ncbi:glycerol-3-phosphate 1-O-acyltransferase PlsY [Orbaceae bacterium ac157xtp]
MLLTLVMITVAYLWGSLPGAMILSKMMHLRNPKEYGSHNPGATNMLRVNGRLPAFCVLVFDMLKGMVPVYVAYRLGISPFYLGLIGVAACLGHIFPCFFQFRGGKGVATALGSMILIGWDFSALLIGTWFIVLILTGYSSTAAIISFLLAPLFVWVIRPELTMPVAMLSCLIILRHTSNIQRLIKGEEDKIYRRK